MEVEKLHEIHRSPERVINLICSVGNSEAKCVTLLAMEKATLYTLHTLHKATIAIPGVESGWQQSRGTPFKHCELSLSIYGLVVKDYFDENQDSYGYKKTPFALSYGDAFSGHMLAFSEKYGIALQDLWGKTASPSPQKLPAVEDTDAEKLKKRSPMVRLKIYKALTHLTLPATEDDIAKAIGETEKVVANHLYEMARYKIISFQPKKIGATFTWFQIQPQQTVETPAFKKGSFLKPAVFNILRSAPNRRFSVPEVVAELIKQDQFSKMEQKKFTKVIYEVLDELCKSGYLLRSKETAKRRNFVSLTDEQSLLIKDLLRLTDAYEQGQMGIIEEGKTLAKQILTDKVVVESLMKRAKASSSSRKIHNLPKAERALAIINLIKTSLGCTNRDIQQSLAQDGMPLSIDAVNSILKQMARSGQIKSIKAKGFKTYFPIN